MPQLITVALAALYVTACRADALAPYGLAPLFLQPSPDGAPAHIAWKLRGTSLNATHHQRFHVRVSSALNKSALHDAYGESPLSSARVLFPADVLSGGAAHHSYSLRVGDGLGHWSAWASAAPFVVAPPPHVSAWGGGAEWICTSPASRDSRASMLRTNFTIPPGRGAVASAILSIIGLGQFAARLNGAPVGDGANSPAWTAWEKRLLFSTVAVPPSSLLPGENVLAVTLGNGMFNVQIPPNGRYTKWTGSTGPRMLLLQLRLTFGDASTMDVVSTSSGGAWLATDGGAVTFTHQYAGEDRNATLETRGWDAPGWMPDSNPLVAWSSATNCTDDAPAGVLQPMAFEPIRVMDTLPSISAVPSAPAGTLLIDVGRNFAGSAALSVAGVPPGATVRVTPSETVIDGIIHQCSGGCPAFYDYVMNNTGNDIVHLEPTFYTSGWRWLAVNIITPPPHLGATAYNGTLRIASATYGGNCGAASGDATAAVASFCNSLPSCSFEVCVCGDNTCGKGAPPCLPDPAQNCAKDFNVSYECTGDVGPARSPIYIPAEADNNAALLTCIWPPPPPPPQPVLPNVTAAEGRFTRVSAATVGSWSSSNAWVNRIFNLTLEAIYANLQSVLTDCPHRERLGWLEVSHLMMPSIALNVDISRLWAKIALDTVDSQLDSGMVPDIAPEYTVFNDGFRDSPEWGSAAVLNPFWLHATYGDLVTLNATFATAVRYVDYLLSKRDAASGLLLYGLSDWIPVVPSPSGVTATATLVQDLQALAVAAAALNFPPAVAANYTSIAADVAAAYQRAFFDASTGSYPTQCAAGMALILGITPPEHVAAARAYLLHDVVSRGNVTTAGEIGNRYVLLALGEMGQEGIEAVWASLLRADAPGYGWMLTMGETALAESWTDAPGDSHIHAMYGHIAEFLFKYVAGVRPAAGAGTTGMLSGGAVWSSVVIAPTLLPALDWVSMSHDSPRGLFTARYTVTARGSDGTPLDVELRVEVPPGVGATVVLPLSGTRVDVSGGGARVLRDSSVQR